MNKKEIITLLHVTLLQSLEEIRSLAAFPSSLPPSSPQDRLLSLEGLSRPRECLALPGHSRGFLSNVLLRSFTSSGLPTLS